MKLSELKKVITNLDTNENMVVSLKLRDALFKKNMPLPTANKVVTEIILESYDDQFIEETANHLYKLYKEVVHKRDLGNDAYHKLVAIIGTIDKG